MHDRTQTVCSCNQGISPDRIADAFQAQRSNRDQLLSDVRSQSGHDGLAQTGLTRVGRRRQPRRQVYGFAEYIILGNDDGPLVDPCMNGQHRSRGLADHLKRRMNGGVVIEEIAKDIIPFLPHVNSAKFSCHFAQPVDLELYQLPRLIILHRLIERSAVRDIGNNRGGELGVQCVDRI